jgi:hypothetical protein
MPLISKPFRALIIGSSGTIGTAFINLLNSYDQCLDVIGINRHSVPSINYLYPETIQQAFETLNNKEPFQLIINTIGVLHTENWLPEKRLKDLNEVQLSQQFLINSIGPALTIKYFSNLLDREGGVYATLSAKVGSISDNRLGGWFSYRASKAALNMIIKTASIELKRTQPNSALIALHPGTVKSNLSRPFNGERIGREPEAACQDMLSVLLNVEREESGSFKSYNGDDLPW